MPFERASGILLHPTSLPSRGGIGDLGPAAYEFLDFLAAGKQRLWQVLPLGPLGYGNSPYSATSAFAGNPLLISLERLAERGWIAPERLGALPQTVARVDYEQVSVTKFELLREAAGNFLRRSSGMQHMRFERFCSENRWWLHDFALFNLLRRENRLLRWNRWPRELARREPAALERVCAAQAAELEAECALQFFFCEQWGALRRACRQKGVRLIGDLAIFVNYDSSDVWTHPELFHLNDELDMQVVAGVPPDAFSQTGQRWGNPIYRWDVLASRGYDWWVERMRSALRACDIVRLDHFRGFEQYWEIPASEPTAVHGRWVDGPKDALFDALRHALGELPLIAEDLGFITPEVHALRQRLGIPGMRVMQFGFGDPGAEIYLPHRFEPNTVVYTGTHDNDTTRGWWESQATPEERRAAEAYLTPGSDGIHWAFIRAAEASVANLCILPLQDVLGLGSEARMNVPSKAEGNWAWRYAPGSLTPELARRLAALSETSGRDSAAPIASPPGDDGEDFAA
jgi:4-alpha-glucanotransferase